MLPAAQDLLDDAGLPVPAHFGLGRAWADDGGSDAGAFELTLEHSRHGFHAGLRGRVSDLVGARQHRIQGADEDQVPVMLLDHRRQDPPGQQHRAQQVGVDFGTQVLDLRLVERGRNSDAGIVHDHIQGAGGGFGCADEGVDRVFIADVEGMDEGDAARRLDVLRHCFEPVHAARTHGDGPSQGAQRLRDGGPQPRGGAGHERGPQPPRSLGGVRDHRPNSMGSFAKPRTLLE